MCNRSLLNCKGFGQVYRLGCMEMVSSLHFSYDWHCLTYVTDLLRLHYHNVELGIIEVALYSCPRSPPVSRSTVQQQKLRFASLRSAKTWFDIFFAAPAIEFACQGFSIASQGLRSLGTILYLAVLDEPGWSREEARAELDPLWVTDRLIAKLDEAIAVLGIDDEEDVLVRHCQLYRSLRPTWAAKLAASNGALNDGVVASSPAPAATSALADVDDTAMGDPFDWNFIDSEWLLGWPPTSGL